MAEKDPTPKGGMIHRHLAARDEIEKLPAKEAKALRYIAPLMTQVFMPYTDPGNDLQMWHQTNGNTTIIIQPGWVAYRHEPICVGYPYGSIPRLLWTYLHTAVIKGEVHPGSRELLLGDSLAAFMAKLDMEPRGGPRGNIKPLWDQCKRLFSAIFTACESNGDRCLSRSVMVIADKEELWWNPRKPYDRCLWESSFILSQTFIRMMKRGGVPLDARVLKKLRKSPLELDIYAWATRRLTYAEDEFELTFEQLLSMFPLQFTRPRDGAAKLLSSFDKVHSVIDEFRWQRSEKGMIFYPSPSPVMPDAD